MMQNKNPGFRPLNGVIILNLYIKDGLNVFDIVSVPLTGLSFLIHLLLNHYRMKLLLVSVPLTGLSFLIPTPLGPLWNKAFKGL